MKGRELHWAIFLVPALVLGLLFFGPSPAAAEDDLGTVSNITQYGPFRYKLYQYPSRVQAFFFYPNSYVTFDVRNGKYWMLESPRFEFDPRAGKSTAGYLFNLAHYEATLSPEKITVTFYTPDMKMLGQVREVRANKMYSFPRDGNDYEHVVVKMESYSDQNFDVKFLVWDPVDPVIAEPIPVPAYRQ